MKSLCDLFGVEKPVIGMLHLAGDTPMLKKGRAIYELLTYVQEGVDGVIFENYHGSVKDVEETLALAQGVKLDIKQGINILGDTKLGFYLAEKYNLDFIQIDSVQENAINHNEYRILRNSNPHLFVMGGVGFKYTEPSKNSLSYELEQAQKICDAVVTTGSGTGVETPLEKLQQYKQHLGSFPLLSGAGVTRENIEQQLQFADGVIVGSFLKKNNDTQSDVDSNKVREFMQQVTSLRSN